MYTRLGKAGPLAHGRVPQGGPRGQEGSWPPSPGHLAASAGPSRGPEQPVLPGVTPWPAGPETKRSSSFLTGAFSRPGGRRGVSRGNGVPRQTRPGLCPPGPSSPLPGPGRQRRRETGFRCSRRWGRAGRERGGPAVGTGLHTPQVSDPCPGPLSRGPALPAACPPVLRAPLPGSPPPCPPIDVLHGVVWRMTGGGHTYRHLRRDCDECRGQEGETVTEGVCGKRRRIVREEPCNPRGGVRAEGSAGTRLRRCLV